MISKILSQLPGLIMDFCHLKHEVTRDLIPQEDIDLLIRSMLERVDECIYTLLKFKLLNFDYLMYYIRPFIYSKIYLYSLMFNE